MASEGTPPKYAVVIQWSEDDQCYIASLPEWGSYCKAHGGSYEEAAKHAREVLEMLMGDEFGQAVQLPPAKLFHYPGADVVDRPDDAAASRTKVADASVRQTA